MKRSHLADPKGLGRVEPEAGIDPILGEESGLGVTDALPDLGRSSNFLRVIWGVGGLELFALTKNEMKSQS